MLTGRVVITKEEILERYSEEQLFKFYIPTFEKIGRMFFSSDREETQPSCSISRFPNGHLYFKDFGTTDRAADIWGYVQRKFCCNFPQALEKIAGDLGLRPPVTLRMNTSTQNIYRHTTHVTQPNTIIRIKKREWKTVDTDYWFGRYFIPRELVELYNVHPISDFWINLHHVRAEKVAYSYDYYYYENTLLRKIYQPLASKERKWFSNINTTVVQGIANIPKTADLLLITKSLKDVMILKLLGYPAVATNNESSWLPEQVWEKFKTRYKTKVILFDNDAAGIRNAAVFSEQYDLKSIIVPAERDVTDVSDFVMKHRSLPQAQHMIQESLRHAGIQY